MTQATAARAVTILMPTDSETWAIDVRGLTKTFGTVTAVRGLTLQVPSGTICCRPLRIEG